MDDWFTYVLIFIFFVLPMLEGALKKRRGQEVELPPDTEYPEMPAPVRREPPHPRGTATAGSEDSSWSDNWGSWPGEDLEDEQEDVAEPEPAWTASNQPDRSAADARNPVFPRAPDEVPARIPESVDLPDIGRTLEPQRLPDIATRLDQVAKAESGPSPALKTTPSVSQPPSVSTKQRRARVSALLGDRAGVRRAIIASEVLGAPLALRERPLD